MSARDLPPAILAAIWQHLQPGLRASLRDAVAKGLEALKTPEPLNLNEWAERHFYLSAESSQTEQRWVSYPPQRAVLAMMGDDDIEEVDVRKSARVGYTKMLLASVAFDAQHKRRSQCLWQPTDDDSDEFCKSELDPMLRDVRIMRTVLPEFMAKSKSNTMNMKKFLGSILYLKGGKSAGNYRRMTLQSAKIDEFDAFDLKIEKSADPFTLAYKRLEGATRPKILCGTTPRIKGLSHIEKRELAAEARLSYHLPCPHCGVEHPLMWGGGHVAYGFKWDREDPEGTVRHHCPHCRGAITQADYLAIWEQGVWVSDCGNYRCHYLPGAGPDGRDDYHWTDGAGMRLLRPPRHVAVHIWTAYSPQTTWAAIVRQFLQCVAAKEAGDKAPLEGFINETLGETWEEEVEKTDTHALMLRAEDYPLRRVPVGGLQLVAGVDVQDKRWEVTVWAIGRGCEMWTVDYQIIDGNPADERDWEDRLHPYLQTTFTHWHGAPMKIAASAIDTGGHYTHQAYAFCRQHHGHKYFAVKGDSQDGKPIKGRASNQDVNFRGRILKNGVKLWLVGTDTAKDLFFGRLKVTQPGPGYVHFSKHLPAEWFKGLTSEVRRPVRTHSGTKHRWVKTVARNEPLDTTVYALFCSEVLDHYKMTDAQWRRLENDLLPDLFDPIQDMPPPAAMPAPLAIGQIETRDATPPSGQSDVGNPISGEHGAQLSSPAIEIKAPEPTAPAQPVAPRPPTPQRRANAARAPTPAAPLISPFAKPDWSARL